MNILRNFYSLVVLNKQKAIVAFVVGAISAFVVRHGWTLDISLRDALQALLVGVIAHAGVYLKANKG